MNRPTDLTILGNSADAQSRRDTVNGPRSPIRILHNLVEDVLGPQAHIPTMIGCGHADIGIDSRPFWEVGAFTNPALLGVIEVSVLLQLALHHIAAMEDLFQIGQLSLADCGLSLLVGLFPLSVLEATKLVRRCLDRRSRLHVIQ
jgi:hypothetical protein